MGKFDFEEKKQFNYLDALTDASTLELLYELVSRATGMIQTYTRRVKEEQNFRHALLATMKVAKKEQTEIVSFVPGKNFGKYFSENFPQ